MGGPPHGAGVLIDTRPDMTDDHVLRRISVVLAQIDTLLASLGPQSGIVSRVLAQALRGSLHRAIVTPCPFCGAPHRPLDPDLPDGTAAALQCQACDRAFEITVNGLGDVDVYGRASQLALVLDEDNR